jgi:hypothetical protein
MDNAQLIDLASKAFELGLIEGREHIEATKIRTGRSLMKQLWPTAPHDGSNEYRMQIRTVYGAGFYLGQWRRYNRERGEHIVAQ